MDMSTSAQRMIVDASRRGRIEDLLRSYPDVPPGEVAEILRFLKNGPPLEVALLTTDEEIKAKLGLFRSDQKAEFAFGPKEYAAVAFVLIALVALLASLWNSGLGQ